MPVPPMREVPVADEQGTSEKALAVDANVNIKLPCISNAKLSINGWSRNEIRVFIKNGSSFNFRVHEKDPKTGKPVWVLIANAAGNDSGPPVSECLSGDKIEIDPPINAGLTISGREGETVVDSVKKVFIKSLGGDVSLRNISGGITAITYQGNLAVENSAGQISLETSTGNIVAYGVSPGQIGETFVATTNNGTISLQQVEHRQIEAKSVSGTLMFNGKFLPGGLYTFRTSKGSIKLSIPGDSSCKIIASYGFGSFNSALPLKIETETVASGGKSLVGKLGAGNATVNVTTVSGSIGIGKQ